MRDSFVHGRTQRQHFYRPNSLAASSFVTSDLGLSVRILRSVFLLVRPLVSKFSLVLGKARELLTPARRCFSLWHSVVLGTSHAGYRSTTIETKVVHFFISQLVMFGCCSGEIKSRPGCILHPFLSGPLLYFNSELSVGRTMFLICLKSIVKYDHDKSLEKENEKRCRQC